MSDAEPDATRPAAVAGAILVVAGVVVAVTTPTQNWLLLYGGLFLGALLLLLVWVLFRFLYVGG